MALSPRVMSVINQLLSSEASKLDESSGLNLRSPDNQPSLSKYLAFAKKVTLSPNRGTGPLRCPSILKRPDGSTSSMLKKISSLVLR